MILENPPPFSVQIVGKMPKAHEKGIVNLQFVYNGNHVALCSVGHDSIKMWRLNDMEEDNIVVFTQMNEYIEWRCGVQTAHTLPTASCTGVVGADSMIYSLEADHDGSHIRSYDMGYMEVWHRVVVEPGRFITTSFSGFLSEVVDGKFGIREPYQKIKSIVCMNLSPSKNLLAMGGAEGNVEIVDAKTLKSMQSFEAHWTRITSILLLTDDYLLTGGMDKYIKYYKISGNTHTLERTLCGHRGAITCMVSAPSIEETKRFASASANGQVIVWNLESSTPLTHIEVPHEGLISALAFSPCGQFLVSGGDDKVIAVYRVAAEPLYENVPLLNSGIELMDEMAEINGGKENEEPTEIREQIKRGISDDEMELDNGAEATTRDLFGDSSDSEEGENGKDNDDGDKDERIDRDEREEREEEYDRVEGDEGNMVEDGGGEYEGYGREENGEEREEEEEGVREEGREVEEREEERDEEVEEGIREEGGYEDEERRMDEQEYEVSRRDNEEDKSDNEEEEDGGYIPSQVKKEEPMYGGYGDSPREEHLSNTTPPYEED